MSTVGRCLGTLKVQGEIHRPQRRKPAKGYQAGHMAAAQAVLLTRLTIDIDFYESEHAGIREDQKYMGELVRLGLKL